MDLRTEATRRILVRFEEKYGLVCRPSEHPPVRGEMSKRLVGGIIGHKDKTSSWHLNGSLILYIDGVRIIRFGDRPTVIHLHVGTTVCTGFLR